MRGEFEGLVAAVTGGGSGIGAAVADALERRGARIAVIDLRAPADTATRFGVKGDVGSDHSVRSAVDAVIQRFGSLDILVNNAGIGAIGNVEENADDEWMRVLNVNLLGTVRMSRACLPHLRRSPSPSIVNIASIAATAGLKQRALYSASKGAVAALTRAMAADYLSEGIRVNAVNPGTADTPWVQRLLESSDDPHTARSELVGRQPHGRLVDPAEIAEAVAYLTSPSSGSTTGTALAVDGGMHDLRLTRA